MTSAYTAATRKVEAQEQGTRETRETNHPEQQGGSPKMCIPRPETSFRGTGSVCDRKHVRRRTMLTSETLRNVEETLKKTSLSYNGVTKA
jgi:hypothetical protein